MTKKSPHVFQKHYVGLTFNAEILIITILIGDLNESEEKEF